MKPAYLALAVAPFLCASASAQTSVAVYGVIDTGFAYLTNADATGDNVLKMPSLTGSVPSRVGFRGAEDLGGGLKAVFVLENGIAVDTGQAGQGGRLFGRQAYVGLQTAYGTFMLGRQQNMTFYATQKSDVLGPNLFSISSIDPYIPNARSDNAVGYLGNIGGLVLGATYSTGRDAATAGGPAATSCGGEVPGDARACRQVTALLGVERERYGATVSYDRMHGGPGAANGLSGSAFHDRRLTANGYVMAGATKFGAGVMARRIHAASGDVDVDLYYAGFTHPLTAATRLDVQAAHRGQKSSPNDSTMLVARLTHALSRRTAVYAAVGTMDNEGTAAISLDAGGTVGAGLRQSGIMTGLRHSF